MQKNLKLTDLYESQISKHVFKCLNLNANILPKHSDIHNYPIIGIIINSQHQNVILENQKCQ